MDSQDPELLVDVFLQTIFIKKVIEKIMLKITNRRKDNALIASYANFGSSDSVVGSPTPVNRLSTKNETEINKNINAGL